MHVSFVTQTPRFFGFFSRSLAFEEKNDGLSMLAVVKMVVHLCTCVCVQVREDEDAAE